MSIRLFIADTDREHIERIIRLAACCPDIRIVGICGNGAHALRQLAMTPADILLTELQLPGLDGIMLLHDLENMPLRPAVIVCTRFYSQACVSRVCACGADYILYKPLDYNRLPETMRTCHAAHLKACKAWKSSGAKPGGDRGTVIRGMIAELSIPAKLSGSLYLAEAMKAAIDDPSLLKNLSKGLYAEVALHTHSTPERVERAMRNAVAAACEKGDLERRIGHRPSNRELLIYLMERIELRDPERR